jgi:hypothetical protein
MTPAPPNAEMIQITVGDSPALTVFNLLRSPLCTNILVLSNMVTGYLKEHLAPNLFCRFTSCTWQTRISRRIRGMLMQSSKVVRFVGFARRLRLKA